MNGMFDITPSPRVLRMLGQIEFKPWQCLAELIDNSVDSFLEGRREAMILQPRITVLLPSLPQLRADTGKIQITDNGLGMSAETLEKAVKAGYSGNDPVEKLGLFGMGFNIATARLGRRTEVWTITPGAAEWTGLVIDFDDLEKAGKFQVPRLTRPRGIDELQIHGTQIAVSKLDQDRVRPLIVGRGRSLTQEKLGRIYTRLIQQIGLEIFMDGDKIKAWPHCTWDPARRVETPLGPAAAVLPISEQLPPRPYCTTCWNWLDEGETTCPVCASGESVQLRPREIRGWLGIQRFFHKTHYGIDLIRNGRLIEELDKSLFNWENPDTGDVELEYPIDTTHWGGRIVGELEVDFVRISHQKDAFDKHDPQWRLVRNAIRGDGPIRPHIAESKGFTVNTSPLARLFRGYRTGNVAGLKHLVPGDEKGKGMNEECIRWADCYWAGEADYQTDEKWFAAVLLAEEAKKKPSPTLTTDVIEGAGEPPFSPEGSEEAERGGLVAPTPDTTQFKDDYGLSGTYEIREMRGSPTLTLKACALVQGGLANDQALRFTFQGNLAVFEYDPDHEYFQTSLDTPLNCMLRELSFQLMLRSQEKQDTWPITRVELELRQRYFSESLFDMEELARQARAFLDELREFLLERVPDLKSIDASSLTEADRDAIRVRLMHEGQAGEQNVSEVISSGQFLRYLGIDFLPRAVAIWPELVLDDGFLSVAYITVAEKARALALDQVLGPLRDTVWLCEQATMPGLNQQQWREQLARAAASLSLLRLWRT
jgi:hypothetical protein